MCNIEDSVATEHNVIIIGGGLIGAFIYLDCALRGLDPILFERGDFGAETTSYNTRLAHGGVRYTARKEDWSLVIESLRERYTLKKIAPHLVHDMDFLLPIYDGCIDFPLTIESILDSHYLHGGLRRLLQTSLVHAGMSTYDFLGGSRFPFRFLAKDRLTKHQLLTQKDLLGIRVYSDGKISSPERLALEAILKGDEEGGRSFNYAEVVGFEKEKAGKVEAAIVNSGEAVYTIRGKVIVNATGPWIDTVNRLCSGGASSSLLLRVGGIHVAVSSFAGSEVLGKRALVIPTKCPQGQKRLVFVIPEEGYWLIGTTEKKIDDSCDVLDYKPSRAELESLFDALRRVMPTFDLNPDSEEILHVFAGVRPLRRQEMDPTTASRKDLIHYDMRSGVISVTGKLTPARAIAQRVTDLACRLLGKEEARCTTAHTPLLGGEPVSERPSEIAARVGIAEETAKKLIGTYGWRHREVLAYCEKDNSLRQEVARGCIMAQVCYAVEREKAVTIADVILRRTDMGKTTKNAGIELVERVGEVMAMRLGWSEEQLRRAVASCTAEIESRYKVAD